MVHKRNFNNKNIYIKTFGCSLNHSDSEVMAGLLREAGFNVISDYSEIDSSNVCAVNISKVDIVIINSCTVKNLAESKFFKELRKWKSKNVKILVAGCITQADPDLLKTILKDISVIGTRKISDVVFIVNKLLSGQIVHNINTDFNERLNLPKVRKIGIIEILPISEGCLSNCSFCKTKFARGNLLSYPREKIIQQFKTAVSEGCKEFWITSQDCGCYGFDIYRNEKYFLPQLLNDLLNIDGDFRIRLGMSNPDHVDRIKDDLVETFKHPKMFKFLHIPVQSGNDKILRDMRRPHTVKDFYDIVSLFRRRIPGITISTDLIAGFPGETDKEFNDTLVLIKDMRFEVLNFSRFWARKGTDAAKMKQLSSEIIKERTEKIKHLFNRMIEAQNKFWMGKDLKILIDEVGKNNLFIGRDDYYRQVVLKDMVKLDNVGNDCIGLKLGDFVNVQIVQTKRYVLIGELHK
jgi:threonylcarbamoyladenosine tRNA methylthiotransferase CDKAL1